MVYERFKRQVVEEGLLLEGEEAICALSGGADSVALLLLLLRLSGEMDLSIRAVHVHHGIRGEEADRDARFVEALCRRKAVPFVLCRVDAPGYARERGIGLEEAGRLLRREALERVSREGASGRPSKICLAHHMEDQAETVLHHLCRGSGLGGLSGIWPKREGYVHPLLGLHKAELLAYLEELGEGFVTDSTNSFQEMTRNRIRSQVLPLLEQQVNSASVEHLCSAARILRQADQFFWGLCQEKAGALLLPSPPGREGILLSCRVEGEEQILRAYLVRHCLALLGRRRDLSLVHVEGCLSLLKKPAGKRLSLGGGIFAERLSEGLFFFLEEPDFVLSREASENTKSASDPSRQVETLFLEEGLKRSGRKERPERSGRMEKLELPGMGESLCQETFCGRVEVSLRPYLGEAITENKFTKWFDYDKIHSDICIRIRQEGDYLLLGQGRRKLLRRFFIDEKVPRGERERVPLLCQGAQVLWVIPYRMGEGARLDSQTKTVLEVSWLDGGIIDE